MDVSENKTIKQDLQIIDIRKIVKQNVPRKSLYYTHQHVEGKRAQVRQNCVETLVKLMEGYSSDKNVQQRLLKCFNRWVNYVYVFFLHICVTFYAYI